MIKYVIFDMDGTLIDTEPIYEGSWLETGKRWGLCDVGELYAPFICGRTQEAAKKALKDKYGSDFDADRFTKERMELYTQLAETKLRLKDGCIELLSFLRENSIPCAIATSTVSDLTHSNLKRMNIDGYFNAVVTSSMVKNGKPAPDIFLEAARRIGATSDECIICEDSYSGIEAAANSKIKPIFIPDRQPPTNETEKLAYATLKSLFDVIEMIKKENNIL